MGTDDDRAKVDVELHRRVIVSDGLAFDARRQVSLPFPPFAGMTLYNAEWAPPGCDESDDPVEEVAYDLKTGRTVCHLPPADFRPGSSGGEWTEEDVRRFYRDWELERDHRVKPPLRT